MNRETLLAAAAAFTKDNPGNYIQAEWAISPDLVGKPMYEAPLLAFGDASDPFFEELRRPDVVGPHHMMPRDFLPAARTVIAFFSPFSEDVRRSNDELPVEPSSMWLHARIEGQAFIRSLSEHLVGLLRQAGHEATAPLTDPKFWSKTGEYTSNWSERHAGYACGLGTFGLCKSLITVQGAAGRYGSIISSLALPCDGRPYAGVYEYCTMCGACQRRCPAHAIDKARGADAGKSHPVCSAFVGETSRKYAPRYGCGKCQVGVPCERRAPGRRS